MNNRYDRKWFFDNGYGASVIQNQFSYGYDDGLYELAVIKGNALEWKLCYDTPITIDVIGWLTPRDVVGLLKQIKEL